MAELEESIYSYSGTLQQKAIPGCTDIHNTDNSQSTALACTRGHDALRTAKESTTQNTQEASGQHTAKRKAELPPHRTPFKKKFVYYKVTFSVFPLYKVSDAGGCLAESVLQE